MRIAKKKRISAQHYKCGEICSRCGKQCISPHLFDPFSHFDGKHEWRL